MEDPDDEPLDSYTAVASDFFFSYDTLVAVDSWDAR